MPKVIALLPMTLLAAIGASCIWWKAECEAQRAPCTIEIGPITLRISREAN